jgi:DNA-binding ferritin-like protein
MLGAGTGTMARAVDDENRWRKRAEDAHAIADEMRDPASKRMMRAIARAYEKLAGQAQRDPPKSDEP